MGPFRLVAVVALALAATGCPYVPNGELRVLDGSDHLGAGDTVGLGLYCDGVFSDYELTLGGTDCEGSWAIVDGTTSSVGGNATLGTLTGCGVYTAPATPPPEPLRIVASECPLGSQCTDSVCSASRALVFDGY